MNIYYVFGVRHEVFVRANSPEEARVLAKDIVHEWEYTGVNLASWVENVLTVVGKPLLESKEE